MAGPLAYHSGPVYVLLDRRISYVFHRANAADPCVEVLAHVDDGRACPDDIDLDLFALQIFCPIDAGTRDVYLLLASLASRVYVPGPADGDRQPGGLDVFRLDPRRSQYLQRAQVLDGQLVVDRFSCMNVGS